MTILDLAQHVQYIMDERGDRKAAVLDISTWQEMLATLEDMEDVLDAAEARRDLEPAISLDDYAAQRATCTKDKNIPIARLVPILPRVTGLHAGAIWTSADFDEEGCAYCGQRTNTAKG